MFRRSYHAAPRGSNTMATGPSSSQSSYLLGSEPNVRFTSILTVGDSVNLKPDGVNPYVMVGIPDGLGSWDNGDGTFTVVMNHELGATAGIARAHGAAGAFVSKWIINKADLTVLSGEDAITTVKLWDDVTKDFYTPATPYAIARLCSADLAEQSAYYWVDTKGTVDTSDDVAYGTQTKIFMTGEETGSEGKEFGLVLEGPEAGIAYELAYTGLYSWENAISSPFAQKKTINIGLDDSGGGQVYVYIGVKKTEGTEVDKADLNDGKVFGIRALNLVGAAATETDALAANGRFELADLGDVSAITGAQLETLSDANNVTGFMRPEDGAFDPNNANVFYFLTTASFTGQSRLYKLTFDDITNPESGGTIEAVLSSSDLPVNGSTGPRMMDNMTISKDGLIYIQEDPGNQPHLAKTWEYNPVTDTLVEVAANDPARFGSLTTPATTPYNQDEENSGIIEVTGILGDADTKAFLVDTQAHYNIPGELVQGGQLAVMYVDEVKDGGIGDDRVAGDAGDNKLNGNRGNDEVLGGSGNDILLGARGEDVLDGGRGNDVLVGGMDSDSFVITVTDGDVDYITDFAVGIDSLDFGAGVSVVSATVQRVVATEANGYNLGNSDRALDLTLVISNGSGTQTLHILDSYAFSTNSFWETELGIDLTYPQPLPTGNDSVLISGLLIA
jgi:Ca2+-binding RTX toxin-like protein